jgi:hypothetical protein
MTGHVYVIRCIFRTGLIDDYAQNIFSIQWYSAPRTFRQLVIRTTSEPTILVFNAQKTWELLSRDDWCSRSTPQISCCYRDDRSLTMLAEHLESSISFEQLRQGRLVDTPGI